MADATKAARVVPATTQLAAATIQSVSMVASRRTLSVLHTCWEVALSAPPFPSDDQMPWQDQTDSKSASSRNLISRALREARWTGHCSRHGHERHADQSSQLAQQREAAGQRGL